MSDSDQNSGRQSEPPPPTDAELVERFAATCDAEAFRELVLRHERLVMGVCRRVLWDAHDTEDAFQATFMILAAKSRKLRSRADLSGWLYAVAHRTAIRARARKQRRREQPLGSDLATHGDALAEMARRDQMQRFDEELNGLPKKYRDPLVLHYLVGKSQKEVARELGLTVRTVEGRLRRAKNELRYRLAKQGVGMGSVAVVVQGELTAAAASAAELVNATVHSAVNYVSGGSAAAGSETAQYLVRKELSNMASSSVSLPTAAVAVVASALILATAGEPGQQQSAAAESGEIDLAGTAGDDKEAAAARSAPVTAFEAAQPSKSAAPGENGSGAVDYREIGEQEQRIYTALEQPTQLDFFDVPLSEVAEVIARTSNLRVFIDPRGLAQENIRRDTPITFDSQGGIPLKHALQRILDTLHLDYVVTSEYLLMTSERRAQSMMEARVYNARAVTERLKSDELAQLIKDTIRPNTWEDPSLSTAIQTLPDGLVVTHCQRAHEEIAALIRQLERYAAEEASE